MKRKLTMALAIMSLLTVFAACSSGKPAETSGKETETVTETVAESETAGDAAVIAFETVDLDGNAVRSEDIFSENTLTMVNLWGTYCGPCINEMPELEVLGERLQEKDCAIVGIVLDVSGIDDTAMVQTAKDILADTGVTYLNLLPWRGVNEAFPAQYIPTTYFVDAQGHIVGEPAIGARGADDYEALIDEVLE